MKNVLFLSLASVALLTTACSNTETKEEVAAPAEIAAVVAITETNADTNVSVSALNTETGITEENMANDDGSSVASGSQAEVDSSNGKVAAIEYSCENGDATRTILVFNNPEATPACEVVYEKASGSKTLWQASEDTQYCADKAAAFAAKQVGWGWNCIGNDGVAIAAPVPVEAAVVEAPATTPAVEAETAEMPAETAEATPAEAAPAEKM